MSQREQGESARRKNGVQVTIYEKKNEIESSEAINNAVYTGGIIRLGCKI